MKLAMRVGRHYRMREIQPRHFEELARACRYPVEAQMAALQDLAERLPDESATLLEEAGVKGAARTVLTRLQAGLVAQCETTKRLIGKGALQAGNS